MFKRYIDYLKDNPEGYWFKRKLFGWGWTPATWQGWTITGIFILFIVILGSTIGPDATGREVAFMFFLPAVILTSMFIRIAYKKGEKPKWMWGFPKKDAEEESH